MNSSTFVFQPLFEASANELLKSGAAATGVSIQVTVTWRPFEGSEDLDSRTFKYGDALVTKYIGSYKPASGKYGQMFTLTLVDPENYVELQCNAKVVSDTRVSFRPASAPAEVTEEILLTAEQASAVVAEGTKLEKSGAELSLVTTEMENTTSSIVVGEGETARSMDIHVNGLSKDNTVPVIVTVNEFAVNGLNEGNIVLYHVENGEPVKMTRVYSAAEVDTHNEYYYDIATGTVTMALANFCEVAVVSDDFNFWNGETKDVSWYNTNDTQFYIYNADQLAGFGAIVDGTATYQNGAAIAADTFKGKTVTLCLDVHLSDGKHTDGTKSFNPIGFGYEFLTYNYAECTGTGKVFKGTFDGNGNTIHGLYQNCWQMGADTYTYSAVGAGLFASVVDATIKNLTMDNAYIVLECVDMGTVVGYANGICHFENIVVKNSVLGNHNRCAGGAIGEIGGGGTYTLKNVDVEASTTISGLWGSFGVSAGGLIGGKWGEAGTYYDKTPDVSVTMENCDVACTLDVYNDVTSAYQWYAYRFCGMLIGNTEEWDTEESGRTVATASWLTTKNCTVQYGDWVNYTYCRFSETTSLGGRYPWVRVEPGRFTDPYSNIRYGVPQFAKGTLNAETHINDKNCHAETDEHCLPIIVNQLYGGDQGVYGGNSHVGNGVTVIGQNGPVSPVNKFNANDITITTGSTLTLGQLFTAVDDLGELSIQNAYVYAFVSPADETSGVQVDSTPRTIANASTPWTDLELTFNGTGAAKIIISDYYYCEPTTIYVNVVEEKTASSVTEVPAANELTYTGSAQELVSGGTAEGGKLVYSVNGIDFTETVPTGTDAGIYKIYYKVQGDATHFDSEVATIIISIAKADSAVTKAPSAKSVTYTGSAQALVTAGTVSGGKLVYSLTEEGTYTASVPAGTDAGEYTVFYKVEGDNNYNASTGGSVTVTIAKAVASCTVTATKTWTYDGTEQALVKTSNVKGESVVYSLTEDGEFTAEIPTTANAGTYTVHYKVIGNDNYIDSVVMSVIVTVNKAESTVTAAPVVKQELTYNKEEQPLVDAGTASGGEIWYKVEKQVTTRAVRSTVVDEDGFSPEIPTAKNAGTYTVYYKVKGDNNHNDSAVSHISVTVKKANPVVTTPNVETTYGDTLNDATLDSSDQEVRGTLTWNDDTSTSVGNAGTNSFTATFVPEDTENYNTVEVEIPVQVQQAVPTYTLPENLTATYGEKLADVDLTEGFTWKDENQSVGNAGTNTFTVVFNPGDSNYKTLELEVQVEVAKATPTYTEPTGLTATYGQKLLDVTLPAGFAWKNTSNSVGNAGNRAHTAVFTPADTANYNIVEVSVTISVAKADPSCTIPTDLTATYGDTLDKVNLPDGFAWKNSSASVGNVGTNSFDAIYNPDPANFNDANVTVSIVVNKADPSYTIPTNLTATYGDTLDKVKLPDGFAWKYPSASAGEVGEQTHTAVFTHADTANYNIVEVSVTVEVRPVAVQKFETKFTGNFLYRVGNQNTVSLNSLFKAIDDVTIGNVSVAVESLNGTTASGIYTSNATWTNGTIQFSGTGVVKVTITDNDFCTPTELTLQVVDATNATSAANATGNNIVLLNNAGFSSLEISGGYTLYGNGFTLTCGSDSYAADLGYSFVTLNNGTLDNVQIVCPNFDYAALYKSNLTSSDNRSYTDSNGKTRYYNARSAVMVSGNSQILNSRISGGRAAVNVSGGNLLIDNSRIELGAVASILVGAANNVTLRDVTLVQKPTASTYDSTKKLMGFSVLFICDSNGNAAPMTLEGTLIQNAWVNETHKQYIPSDGQSIVTNVLKQTDYLHDLDGDGKDESLNLGFAYIPESAESEVNATTIADNRTNKADVPYNYAEVQVVLSKTYVYSYENSNGTDESFKTESMYESNKYGDIITVIYSDTADGLESGKSFGADGWVYELNVDLDKLPGYVLDFSKLSMAVNGVLVTDYTVNGSTKPTSPVTVPAGGTTYVLTAEIDGKEYTATYKVTGTETSKESPTLVAANYEAGLCVASSYGGTWHGAAPALEGIQIKYWSVAEKQYKTITLSDYTPTTKGQQNGTNPTWTYSPANGDFTLTLTGGQVHSSNNVYAMPVVCEGKLYFVASKSSGLVNSGNSARTIPVSYSFKDNNNGDELQFSHTWSVAENKDAQYKYSDFCNGTLTKLESSSGGGCVAPDTLVTLADGTQVRVDSLTGTEQLLVWNMVTGQLDSAPILFVDSETEAEYEIVHLYFSDGTDVKVIYEHGFWDYDLNKYVYLDENAAAYIGHTFAKQNGDQLEKVTLVDVVIVTELTTAWSPVTAEHLCYFVNGMLSMPGGVGGLFNIFDVDPETMTYDFEKMEQDIATYGLFTYEELKSYAPSLTEEMFNECGGAYLKVSIGKGNMTMDELVTMIERYSKFF